MGQPERALADFTKAIELSATSETYGMRLTIIASSANTSGPIADYDKTIELSDLRNSATSIVALRMKRPATNNARSPIFRQALALKESDHPRARSTETPRGERPYLRARDVLNPEQLRRDKSGKHWPLA